MSGMARRKRIYNPVTRKYYSIRQRTTKKGRRGQIKGLWTYKRRKKKTIWSIL